MARYGFQVDYVLDIDTTSSAERRFDLVKISSFPSNAQRAAFENDPLHTGSSRRSITPRQTISSGSTPSSGRDRSGRRQSHG